MKDLMMKIAFDPTLGMQEVPFAKVLTPNFMKQHTKFPEIKDFFNAVGVTNQSELESMPDSKMNEFVVQQTDFSSWQELLNKATTEYVINVLK